MIIVWALTWWYGAGWKGYLFVVQERLARSVDYFSIIDLLRTLFAPYRQISAGKVSGSIGVKWRAFIDRLISRVIGAVVRLVIITIGSVWLTLQALFGLSALALWAVIPLLPIIGFVLMLTGWVPTWR